jgi:hypothetical protein
MRCVVFGGCLSCTRLGSPSLATPAPQQATDQGGTDRDTYDHRCPANNADLHVFTFLTMLGVMLLQAVMRGSSPHWADALDWPALG